MNEWVNEKKQEAQKQSPLNKIEEEEKKLQPQKFATNMKHFYKRIEWENISKTFLHFSNEEK